MSNRRTTKIFRINDEILRLREQARLTEEELRIHEHLHDDASRDAAVSDHPFDREDARETAADVARFERTLADLKRRIVRLEAKREKLTSRLE